MGRSRQMLHILWVCAMAEDSLIERLLVLVPNLCPVGRHYLPYPGQETSCSSALMQGTISVFQGCLLYSLFEKIGTKVVNVLYCKDMQKYKRPIENSFSTTVHQHTKRIPTFLQNFSVKKHKVICKFTPVPDSRASSLNNL